MNFNWKTPVLIGLGTLITASGFVCILRKLYKETGRVCECHNRVKNKVIVITGATSGIGFEIALQLAKQGARLYLLCRDNKLGKRVASAIKKKSNNIYVYFVPLNFTNLKSIDSAVEKINSESKIDILIHNAGIFHAEPKATKDGFEVTFQTNFIGPVVLTDKLLHLIIEAKAPRIVFINSKAHELVSLSEFSNNPSIDFKEIPKLNKFNHFISHYAMSKFALKLFASHLSGLNSTIELKVASIDPGNVYSKVYRNCFTRFYQFPSKLLCALFMQTCYEGAQSAIHACNADQLTSGCLIRNCEEVEGKPSDQEVTVAGEFMTSVNETLHSFLK